MSVLLGCEPVAYVSWTNYQHAQRSLSFVCHGDGPDAVQIYLKNQVLKMTQLCDGREVHTQCSRGWGTKTPTLLASREPS